VDYTNFPEPEEKSPPPIKTQEKTTNQLLAMNLNRRLRDERKGFENLKFTGAEAKLVDQFYQLYWDPDGPKAQV